MSAADVYHDELITAALQVGLIAESAQWFSYRVAERLHATGVSIDDLTVRQIHAAIEAERGALTSRPTLL